MQLHLGPIRNQNPRLLAEVGPDAGGDSVGLTTDPFQLGAFLGDLARENSLPNTILYNLNPTDNAVLSTMAVNFAPKVQFGAAWWFNDTIRGMRRQIDELMENGLLAKSVGMLTDSRSFSSFPRHEYYRRILCQRLGELVESGQYRRMNGRWGRSWKISVGRMQPHFCTHNRIMADPHAERYRVRREECSCHSSPSRSVLAFTSPVP